MNKFNKENRWTKRGIAVVPMEFPISYLGTFPAFVTIHQHDGTVAISHGGIEMGQGINTKVAQVAAHVLDIPYEYVKVKATTNLISANAFISGGSITSDTVCFVSKMKAHVVSPFRNFCWVLQSLLVAEPSTNFKHFFFAFFHSRILNED